MRGTFEVCVIAVLGLMVVGTLMLLGGAAISRSIADWHISNNAVTIAQIQADRDVRIAEIEADATKKTSWAFVAFYLARYGAWVASGLCVVGGGLWAWGQVRS